MEKIIHWGEAHPYMLGAAVVAIGLLLLWVFGFFSGSGQTGNSDIQAYYAAETAGSQAATAENIASTQYGDQLMAAQAQYNYLTQASADTVSIAQANATAQQNIAAIQGNAAVETAGYQATVMQTQQVTQQLESSQAYIENLSAQGIGTSNAAIAPNAFEEALPAAPPVTQGVSIPG